MDTSAGRRLHKPSYLILNLGHAGMLHPPFVCEVVDWMLQHTIVCMVPLQYVCPVMSAALTDDVVIAIGARLMQCLCVCVCVFSVASEVQMASLIYIFGEAFSLCSNKQSAGKRANTPTFTKHLA